jgi:hypothetical protein
MDKVKKHDSFKNELNRHKRIWKTVLNTSSEKMYEYVDVFIYKLRPLYHRWKIGFRINLDLVSKKSNHGISINYFTD